MRCTYLKEILIMGNKQHSKIFYSTNCKFDARVLRLSLQLGASTVKWTALDPCSGLSESDPKLYTNSDLYEIEIQKHLESI
jgi:hypothetical protein